MEVLTECNGLLSKYVAKPAGWLSVHMISHKFSLFYQVELTAFLMNLRLASEIIEKHENKRVWLIQFAANDVTSTIHIFCAKSTT